MNSEKVLLNPERMRIIQYLTLHTEGTATDILQANSDITRTTLYRHMNLLEQHGFICIAKETRIRGTIEKSYRLNTESMPKMNARDLINTMLLGLMTDFGTYLNHHAEEDMAKDYLLCQTSSIFLSDEEYAEFLTKLSELVVSVVNNKENPDRKLRRLTFISSPSSLSKK